MEPILEHIILKHSNYKSQPFAESFVPAPSGVGGYIYGCNLLASRKYEEKNWRHSLNGTPGERNRDEEQPGRAPPLSAVTPHLSLPRTSAWPFFERFAKNYRFTRRSYGEFANAFRPVSTASDAGRKKSPTACKPLVGRRCPVPKYLPGRQISASDCRGERTPPAL
ncbi:hypothetical protein EVAR_94728_1 [Eumeta japonica]|uniref:Uncharacterized protein n=1 Tax=Eumeta variegata TaxID=151549 RepID=A0A4C1UVT5_EUMVA|nr:hypothetical protein EVAR_94728_1 [Eumeta japonica]